MVIGRGNFSRIYRVERVNDLVILLKQMSALEIGKTIDRVIKAHGNWTGLSLGKLTEIWLSYILSENAFTTI